MKVAVLGCGPAGLFAAHAATVAGHDVTIFSNKRKSQMFGAQYLHAYLPGLTRPRPDFQVHYSLRGTVEGYAEKVYGEVPPDFVSPAKLAGQHQGWDIRAAYDLAWEGYADRVHDIGKIDAMKLQQMVSLQGLLVGFRRIISTIPAPAICLVPKLHTFGSREAWAVGDAPERGVECPVVVDDDMVVCDGTPDVGWYRAANIAGFRTAEWPEGRKPPLDDVAKITKVVSTNCDCWRTSGFWRTGRYGAWNKKVLTHHAYWDILAAFTGKIYAAVDNAE